MMTSIEAIEKAEKHLNKACADPFYNKDNTGVGIGYATLALALQEQERRVTASQHVDRTPR